MYENCIKVVLYGYAHIQNVTEKDIKEREDMNMFWVELILVLAIIFLGVRKGGTFLAMAGGVGMLIMTFFFHVTPADPPVTVILIMIAVIVAAATMQACVVQVTLFTVCFR